MQRNICFLLAAASLSACTIKPDFVISRLDLSSPSVPAGATLVIDSEITNTGTGAAPLPNAPGSSVSTSMDIAVYRDAADAGAVGYLTGWGPSRVMAPGDSEAFRSSAVAPAIAPGAYVACGDVDPSNHTDELDETNNRRCTPIQITAAVAKPDLVFEFVRPLHNEQASFKLDAVIRNVGTATAGIFRVDAFQRSPERWPVLLTSCPLTPAQRAAGGSAPCPAIFSPAPLAPGDSWAVKMWVTMPTDRPSGAAETLDFMVDGCHAPLEPAMPAWCRIDEANEANNQVAATISVP